MTFLCITCTWTASHVLHLAPLPQCASRYLLNQIQWSAIRSWKYLKLWFMCLQHLFPNMQKWSKAVSKRQRVTEKQSQWVFVHVAATPICFLLLLWQVFVRGFFTVLGWSTVIEHPHRAEQKPCSFIWTVFKTWNRPKFRKTSRNKTSASGESSAARILHGNEYFFTFLTLTPLLYVQVDGFIFVL